LSDADEDLLPFEELEGAYVTLKLVGYSDQMGENFKKYEEMRVSVGATEQVPDEKWLVDSIEDEDFKAWEILQDTTQIGYAFLVLYDGPPFITFYYFEEPPNLLDIGKDCLEQMIPVFFKDLDEPALFYYLPKPVDEELHAELIEGGFDAWEENPTIDNDALACYVLERYTYDAYYGDGEEEFEEGEPKEY